MIESLKHRIQNQTEDLLFFFKGVEPFSNTKRILIDIDFQKYLENGHYNEVKSFLNHRNFSILGTNKLSWIRLSNGLMSIYRENEYDKKIVYEIAENIGFKGQRNISVENKYTWNNEKENWIGGLSQIRMATLFLFYFIIWEEELFLDLSDSLLSSAIENCSKKNTFFIQEYPNSGPKYKDVINCELFFILHLLNRRRIEKFRFDYELDNHIKTLKKQMEDLFFLDGWLKYNLAESYFPNPSTPAYQSLHKNLLISLTTFKEMKFLNQILDAVETSLYSKKHFLYAFVIKILHRTFP